MPRKRERRQQPGAVHYTAPAETHEYEKDDKKGYKNNFLTARTPGQKEYIRTVVENDVTLCTGPPGTGKTHIACGLAVERMRWGEIDKIILTRPTGRMESDIGYLPGGIQEKLGPALRPLFDELACFCEYDLIKQWMDMGKLEIVPLSAMRGRTFKFAFVILDEAQNASYADLKMFLTRFGQGSTVIASGDLKQTDLPAGDCGALAAVIDRLHDLDGVGIATLSHEDVVRHKLTSAIDRRL